MHDPFDGIAARTYWAGEHGNPDEFTIRQLAELVIELTGSKSPLIQEPLPSDDPKQRSLTFPSRGLSYNGSRV